MPTKNSLDVIETVKTVLSEISAVRISPSDPAVMVCVYKYD